MFNATDSLDLVNVVLSAVLFIWMIVSHTSYQCQFSPNNVISIHTQCSQENNYENY